MENKKKNKMKMIITYRAKASRQAGSNEGVISKNSIAAFWERDVMKTKE